MKKLLILAMLTIFIFACKDEGAAGPQQEEIVLSINHILTIGECDDASYCIFEFKIENDSIYTIKKSNSESTNLSDVKKSYSNSDIKLDSLTNLIDFNNVKNESYITDCNVVDEGCFELYITTNFREIYVKYGQLPDEFLTLENLLRTKRLSFEF